MPRYVCTRLLAAAGLVALACGVAFADHSWGGYHWARTSNPFTVKVGDNVSSAWDAYLGTMIPDWSQSSMLDLTVATGGTRPRNCRPTPGRIEVCSDRYGTTGWLGIAQVWIAEGVHITQATTKLNDTYFNTATYNTPAWRQYVVCQEVGHNLGLAHVDENFDNSNSGTCMDYGDPTGDVNQQHPNAHDYLQLEAIYAHSDTSTTVGAVRLPSGMPPAMGQIDFDTPRQWGRLIRSSRDGRKQVYELDFGRGNKVITEVFWADGQ